MPEEKQKHHQHLKPKIAISGAAETGHCGGQEVLDIARELGREVARQGAITVNGATTGFPLWAARGAKEEGGVVIGLSPATNEAEHVELYHLPLDYLDMVIYTGSGYSGRNLLLTRAADAVIVGCGRIGTINEFTIAFEDKKPLGVLEGGWPTDEVIQTIVKHGHRENPKLIFDKSPKELVSRTIALIEKEKEKSYGVYTNSDKFYTDCDGTNCKIIL